MEHQFILQPYKSKASRYDCPSCHKKKSFARYINTDTGEHLHPDVGRCDRESSCGYHYKPKQYFMDNQDQDYASPISNQPSNKIVSSPIVFIPKSILDESQTAYQQNRFYQYLLNLFGLDVTNKLAHKYLLGTSNDCYRKETGYWEGATVFWFIDITGKIRAGQVKLFDENGHTAKYTDQDGSTSSCTDGIHTPLKWSYKKRGEDLPEWLSSYVEGKKITCFFGEHLLRDTTKTIAVVEAPKTAIIASAYLPQFIWIAVGALSYLTEDRCQVLAGRKVILYPDLSKKEPGKLTTYEKWCAKAKELSHITNFKVSNLLEQKATELEREQGLDLADYLIKIPYEPRIVEKEDKPQENIGQVQEYIVVDESENIGVESKIEVNATAERFHVATSTQNYQSNHWFGTHTTEPESWHQDILELKTFFSSVITSTQPVHLDACTTITDMPLFVQAHMETIQNNNGKRAYLPYLERLQQLKFILTQQQPT